MLLPCVSLSGLNLTPDSRKDRGHYHQGLLEHDEHTVLLIAGVCVGKHTALLTWTVPVLPHSHIYLHVVIHPALVHYDKKFVYSVCLQSTRLHLLKTRSFNQVPIPSKCNRQKLFCCMPWQLKSKQNHPMSWSITYSCSLQFSPSLCLCSAQKHLDPVKQGLEGFKDGERSRVASARKGEWMSV